MGRKIPGKKHRGVKDPNKQRAKREAELETKINAPPKNIEDQAIPKSLERLIKLKNDVKNSGIVQKKRKRKKGLKLISVGSEQQFSKLPHAKAKPDKVVPVFNQKFGESGEQFLHRVNRETRAFVKESEFETKFNVEVKRNPKTGLIEDVIKKPKDEIDELAKLQSKHKNIKKKKKTSAEGEVKLTKSQKRREKLLKKKQKKISDNDEIKDFKKLDKVEFGEVAHAPPELKPLSKNNPINKVKNKNLLLNSLLQENKSSNTENAKTIDRSGKRKDLPLGERRQLEKQQNDAIAAYRLLKSKKFGATSISA